MNLIYRFFELCLFRVKPSDIPASRWLLKLSLVIYFILATMINQLDASWTESIIISLVDIAFLVIIAWVLLHFYNLQTRYLQMTTALAGTGICLSIIGYPAFWWFYHLDPELRPDSFSMMLIMILVFWSLMITSHIFRYTLEIKVSTATLLTIAYTALAMVVSGLAMGLSGGTA